MRRSTFLCLSWVFSSCLVRTCQVAIKIVDLGRFREDTAALMLKEISILKSLKHRNIIEILEVKDSVAYTGALPCVLVTPRSTLQVAMADLRSPFRSRLFCPSPHFSGCHAFFLVSPQAPSATTARARFASVQRRACAATAGMTSASTPRRRSAA